MKFIPHIYIYIKEYLKNNNKKNFLYILNNLYISKLNKKKINKIKNKIYKEIIFTKYLKYNKAFNLE